MTRNVVIICFCVFVTLWNVYLKKSELFSALPLKFIARALLVFCIFAIFIPNIPVVYSLYTEPIKGKVVDSTTNMPIANCNIIASWDIQSIVVPFGSDKYTYHQYITKTDTNGEYIIPRHMKPLSIIEMVLIRNGFGGVGIVAYTHGYSLGASGIDEHGNKSSFDMRLHKPGPEYVSHTISTLEAIFNSKNYKKREFGRRLSYGIMSYEEITQEDKRYILEECRIFDARLKELVKTHRYRDTMNAMEALSQYYEKLGDIAAAEDVKKRTKELFPDPSKVEIFVREKDTQLFKRLRREGKL